MGGGVDEIHMAGREDRDGVNAKEQFQNSQVRNCKSLQVKTKAACRVTPLKKTTSTANVPQSEQASEHSTTNRRGTPNSIILVLCIIFYSFKLKIVSELIVVINWFCLFDFCFVLFFV
jgi:hypothetical protein